MSDPKVLRWSFQWSKMLQMSQGKELSLKFKHFLVIESRQGNLKSTICRCPVKKSKWRRWQNSATGLILQPVLVPTPFSLKQHLLSKKRQSCSLESTLASWTVLAHNMPELRQCHFRGWVCDGLVFPVCPLAENTALGTSLAWTAGWWEIQTPEPSQYQQSHPSDPRESSERLMPLVHASDGSFLFFSSFFFFLIAV